MSAVPAQIQVEFQAQYIGTHRVCYRIGGSGSYTCTTTVCSVVGTCTADLDIFVDNETCDEVTYNGYVQPACVAEDSTEKRVSFSVTFTPSPTCKSYQVTCSHLAIESISVTSGGAGYTPLPGPPPAVNVIGGNGVATAIATVGTGALSGTGTITNPGSGYVNGTYTNVIISGGGGSGGRATVVISGNSVASITVTTAGSGYTTGSSLTLDNTNIAPANPTVTAEFTLTSNYGKVISIAVNNAAPFDSIPVIAIAPGSSPATATAVMEDCPVVNNPGCSGADIDIAAGTLTGFGESVTICGYSLPTVDPAYEIEETGNCVCGCTSADITISGSTTDTVRYFYNKCGEEPRTGILTVGGSPSTVVDCIVAGSLVFQILDDGAEGEVNYGDECST